MTYPQTIKISDITIDPDRQRKDLGNLDDEIESISEIGLIEPIVLVQKADGFHLVAGERRLLCLKALEYEEVYHGVTSVPGQPGYICLSEADRDTLEQIEFDENVRRKQLTWQERTLAIARRHRALKHKAALQGRPWFNRETGKLLDVTAAQVDYILIAADLLERNDTEAWACTSAYDVIKVCAKRKEDESERRKMDLAIKQMPHITAPKVQPSSLDALKETETSSSPFAVDPLCFNAPFQDWAKTQADGSFNHIITDPPYAIDMEYIQQAGIGLDVGATALTHDVKSNLNDMPTWLAHCYRLLNLNGFCVWWTDQMTWQYIYDQATLIGFAVQRWPIVWVKSGPCQNGSAQYNFTKKTEIAMVMRKKGSTIANTLNSSTNVWTGTASSEQARTGHPFAKPIGLHKFFFDALCLKGQTVLDPFAGRGTLATAAIEWGLKPTSVEIDNLHYPYLVTNVQEAYKKLLGHNTIFTNEPLRK